ncbi:hypothetical protein CHLRE_12g526950v5 [Chlamydomonas reinhardtii]|uniref:TFIID subunit TAF5 NTD2 domain-containing protein n=1 Tax=Chlamydomonas reinhardtii TaxID=3055 RepID=A0A2K3D4K9_CHLRE|nr:uncharacterized protein CHLRE_12g526950v5 [Chlamydomonas reinhardtii]PNW75451.1 hypothetical protein CHLRE_12g526950v5 [Chlamydomonas reinhardtii]
MRDSDWDQLFLQYIRKRGLRDVEERFVQHVRQPPAPGDKEEAAAVAAGVEMASGLIDDLVCFAAGHEAAVYGDAYEALVGWVDSCLDMYRPELRRLLHPVFVRLYLTLVDMEAGREAAALLARYRARVLATLGGMRRAAASDLSQLAALTSRSLLRGSAFAAARLGLGAGGPAAAKTAVALSPYAHDLLMRWLHTGGGRMLPLLSVVNSCLDLQVLEGLPKGAPAAPVPDDELGDDLAGAGPGGGAGGAGADEGGADAGAEAAEANMVNRTEIKLGLLQGNVEDMYREQQEKHKAEAAAAAAAAAAAGEADPAAADGQEPQTKKAKKAAEKAAAAAAAAAATSKSVVRGERIEHPPFLPRLPDEVVSAALRDISLRAPVTAATPPSCAFFTFVNAKQTLNCSTFNCDGSKIVAGFNDSSVRVYDMPTISQHHALLRRSRRGQVPGGGGGGTNPDGTPAPAPPSADDLEESEPPGTLYLHGHTAAVHAVDFSVDQRLVLSGSSDGTVRVWGAEFGSCLAVYPGHVFPVWDVAACPLGHWFASAGADRVARLWVSERTQPLRLLVGHNADVDVVRWHPNCCLVATAAGQADRTVRLWDVREGKCVRYLPCGRALPGSPTCLALSPDGSHIAAGSDEGGVTVWDLGTARRVAAAPPSAAHTGAVWSLAYSQGDGCVLASGGADETVRLWRNDTGEALAAAGVAAADGGTGADGEGGGAEVGEGAADGAAEGGKEGGKDGKSGKEDKGGKPAGPYAQLGRYRTKSSPVVSLAFSSRNLLLAAGPFHRRGPIT